MLLTEQLLSMSEAAKQIPAIGGRRVHRNSVLRWCNQGLSGVVLESILISGRCLTSVEALERFSRALVEKRKHRFEKPEPPRRRGRTPALRRASKAAAKRTLVRYDAEEGEVAITFRPGGVRSLAREEKQERA